MQTSLQQYLLLWLHLLKEDPKIPFNSKSNKEHPVKSSCFVLLENISSTISNYLCLSQGLPPSKFNSTKRWTFKKLQLWEDVHIHMKPKVLFLFHIQFCHTSNTLYLISASNIYYFLRWRVWGKQRNRQGQTKLRSQNHNTFSATSWSPMKQDFNLSLDSLLTNSLELSVYDDSKFSSFFLFFLMILIKGTDWSFGEIVLFIYWDFVNKLIQMFCFRTLQT